MVHRDYPGNVRELYQLVQRITARYAGSGPVTAGDLPEEDRPVGSGFTRAWPNEAFKKSISEAVLLGTSLQEIKQATAQTAVQAAMHIESGQVKRAATRLGITDRAIQRRRASGQWPRNAEGATEAADASFTVLEAAAGIWSRASSRSARPAGMQQA